MSALPMHHADEALLLDYASGALSQSASLVVATHLALCPYSRRLSETLDALGGAELEVATGASLREDSIDRLLQRLDEAPTPKNEPTPKPSHGFPEPLNSFIGCSVDELPWKGIGGVEICPLAISGESRKTYLMRISGGAKMPRHSHEGDELTLVLEGGYTDRYGAYGRGDLSVCHEDHNHSPVADPEGCICLISTENKLRMGGVISGLVAWWFGV